MVPVEPISLTIGAIALASLFTTCLDCFDLIDAGRNISRDVDIALAKLNNQRAIFVIWGSAIGLYGDINSFNEEILGPEIQQTVYRLMVILKSLFQDAEKYRSRYGLKEISRPPVTAKAESSTAITASSTGTGGDVSGLRLRPSLLQRRATLGAKVRWAIHDKKKFAILLEDLTDLIEQLRVITESAANLDRQRQLLKMEVSIISDIHSLEVIEEGMKEDDPELSDVASHRIWQLTEGSLAGTDLNRALSTEVTYATAFTRVDNDFSRTESAIGFEDGVNQLLSMEEPGIQQPVESAPPLKLEADSSYLAFDQRNNLRAIQELDLQRFNARTPCEDYIPAHTASIVARELCRMDTLVIGHPRRNLLTTVKRLSTELRAFFRCQESLLSVHLEQNDMVCILDSAKNSAPN